MEDLSKQSASLGSEEDASKTVAVTMDNTAISNECNEDNSKENLPTPEGEATLALKIQKQCEFYFSDANILKDQFLFNKINDSPDGYIKLSVIESFKRMQGLSKDHSVIVSALKQSPELEITEDGEMIRRRKPMPKWDPDVCFRTIISNYGTVKPEVTRIENFFKQFKPILTRIRKPQHRPQADVKHFLRNHPPHVSEFYTVVEFETVEAAENAKAYGQTAKPDLYFEILGVGTKSRKWTLLPKKSNNASSTNKNENCTPIHSKFSLNRFREALATSKNSERVELIREPYAPPNESATGFPSGWRTALELQRQIAQNQANLILGASPSVNCLPEPTVQSQCFMDPAIVSVGPAMMSTQKQQDVMSLKPLNAAAEPFVPSNKAAAS